MKRYQRFLLVASSLMLVLGLVTVLGTKPVHALVASMVQVVNDATHPVPNKDVDNPARHTYAQQICTTFLSGTSGDIGAFIFAAVPASKRLVITDVSMRFYLASTPSTIFSVRLGDRSYSTPNYYLFAQLQSHIPAADSYIVNGQVLAYYEVFQQPRIDVFTGSAGSGEGSCATIAGYMVNLP